MSRRRFSDLSSKACSNIISADERKGLSKSKKTRGIKPETPEGDGEQMGAVITHRATPATLLKLMDFECVIPSVLWDPTRCFVGAEPIFMRSEPMFYWSSEEYMMESGLFS